MRKRINRLIFLLVMVCLLAAGFSAMAGAAEQVRMPDLNESSSGVLNAELALTDENGSRQALEGVVLQLYQAAELSVQDGVPEYTLKVPFTESGVDVAGLSASESAEAAAVLAEIAADQEADASAATDANGRVSFSGLAHGMYLVVVKQDENTKAMRLDVAPYLVSVPMAEQTEQGYIWNYIISSYPKTAILEEEKKGQILVTKKTSMYSGDTSEAMTVLDEVFYFGLFLDAEGTQPYADNFMKSIRLENTASGTAVFENLPEGTYYVFETDANGLPLKDGEKVSDLLFSYTCVVESDTQEITFTPEWEETEGQVVFNNIYDELPTGYYFEPKIHITKKVLDGQTEIETDETFYAGVFSEVNGAYRLEQIIELVQNGTVDASFYIQLTEGADPQKFVIFETDKDGNRVDKDSFGYTVEGEGIIELSSEDPEADITIINRVKSEEESETDYTTTTVTTTGSGGGTTGSGSRNVRTGDDTPIVLYLVIMAAAVVLMIILVIVRRKKKR